MNLGTRYKVNTSRVLAGADQVLAACVDEALKELGEALTIGVRAKMRFDRGDERKSVKAVRTGGGVRRKLTVSSSLVQAAVDEEGRKPGLKMPPYKRGSNLFAWIGRKGFIGASSLRSGRRMMGTTARKRTLRGGGVMGRREDFTRQQEQIAFLVARKIKRLGIKAGRPFGRTFDESQALMIAAIDLACAKAARLMSAN